MKEPSPTPLSLHDVAAVVHTMTDDAPAWRRTTYDGVTPTGVEIAVQVTPNVPPADVPPGEAETPVTLASVPAEAFPCPPPVTVQ